MPDPLVTRAAARPDELAVTDSNGDWTNARLESASGRVAVALGRAGVGPGSRIASLMEDAAPAVVLIHAVRRAGAVLVPLNRRSAPPESRYQLESCGARLIVYDRASGDAATAIGGGPGQASLLAIEDLMDADPCSANDALQAASAIDPESPATILFTSGTGGRPKGAILTHGNHFASAEAWAELLRPRPTDRWLACLPLFHVAGLAMVMRASRWGVPLEVHARFEATAVGRAIERGVSHLSLVAPLLRRLLDEVGSSPPPPTLRAILLGGGPPPRSLLTAARAAGLPVVTTYGMTETASGIAAGVPGTADDPPPDPLALRLLPRVELRIVRAGGPAAPGAVGDILVRGPMVFAGYAGAAPEGEVRPTPDDGWFRTGDLGSIDESGHLHVVDRRDDLLISGGENVYPAEVEAVLLAHPAVADAAVVGRADHVWGAVPVAVIVEAAGSTADDATLAAHCRERLAGFKVPVEFHRRRQLPHDASGKIRRREVRESLPRSPS